jgi:hypothetical protein
VTLLCESQRATVLQLPVVPQTVSRAAPARTPQPRPISAG